MRRTNDFNNNNNIQLYNLDFGTKNQDLINPLISGESEAIISTKS